MVTSKLYKFFGPLFLLGMVLVSVAFFSKGSARSVWGYISYILIEAALVTFCWALINFVDLYREPDDCLYCYFRGSRLMIPPARHIGKLPAVAFDNSRHYTIGYISFRDEAGKKKLKFFMLPKADWHLIEELKIV